MSTSPQSLPIQRFPCPKSFLKLPHRLHQSLLSAHPASLVHMLIESTFTSQGIYYICQVDSTCILWTYGKHMKIIKHHMNINKSVLPTTSNHPISTNSTKLRASSQSFQHNPKFIRADATIPILGMRVFLRVCILPTFCKGVEKDTLSKRPKASWNSSTWALLRFLGTQNVLKPMVSIYINDKWLYYCVPWHDITLIWHVFTKKKSSWNHSSNLSERDGLVG